MEKIEKLAIHCPTKELILKVQKKTGLKWCVQSTNDEQIASNAIRAHGAETCVVIRSDYIAYSNKASYREEGYKIITAEQYLKGGENVTVFKIGDEVKITENHNNYIRGSKCTINGTSRIDEGKVEVENSTGYVVHTDKIKLISTQNKEETMAQKHLRKIRIINKTNNKELVKDEAITTQTEENFIRSMILKHAAKLKGVDLDDLHIHPYALTSYETTED